MMAAQLTLQINYSRLEILQLTSTMSCIVIVFELTRAAAK